MKPIVNPRSVLHALQPCGRGTTEVESLLSYFCRLAVTHSTSTLILSRTVAERMQHDISLDYDWHERQLSGLSESALTWSAALCALTTVEGLDALTFLPWRNVISQNGLSMVTRGKFCPQCLAEDRTGGCTPYFRLAWESAEVSVCHRHKVPLQRRCQHCGKDKIRHSAAFVVPGWCTHCGHFLGSDTPHGDKIEPAALWRSRQIGELLASQQVPGKQAQRDDLINAITDIIAQMDGGQSATFARRIGVSKSTVHHWLKGSGTPKLDVSMKIAVQSGISLPKLLSGDLSDWKPPEPNQQLTLNLLFPPKKMRAASRELDWVTLEIQLESFLLLPTPISVVEAAQRLQVEARQLYLRANRTTRMVGARWLAYSHRRQEESLAKALPYIESASRYLMSQGRAVTKREIMKHVPAEVLSTVPHLLHILKQVQAQINGFSGEYIDGLR